MGWKGRKNGALLDAAEQAGFEVLVTSDVALLREQNLAQRRIAIVVVRTNKLRQLHAMADVIVDAVQSSIPGTPIVLAPPSA